LFVNGKSVGVKKRNSQDFPAAGLRWLVQFKEGENQLKAVGRKNGAEVIDEIKFSYQTEKWDKPAQLELRETVRKGEVVTIQAQMQDQKGVACLDARKVVRFGLIGDGQLIDNLGTSKSARKVELCNGRAEISLRRKGELVVSVSSEGMPTAFLVLK
jgi:beta-galactosidase